MELKHYGVLGMRWGIRKHIKNSINRRNNKIKDKEKNAVINSSKNIEARFKNSSKLPKSGLISVTGTYRGYMNQTYVVNHFIDKHGKVKLSSFNSTFGYRIISAGKSYIDNDINLNDYFNNAKNIKDIIEYDIYK